MRKIINIALIVSLVVVARLLPHPPNMAPVAAVALFGGVYISKKYALVLPLISLFISDIFLGFHSTMPFVYGSFFLTGLIGLWLRNHNSYKNIVGAALISSILFFVITNFGVWLEGNMYMHNLSGLIQCYVMAIPFFRNTVVGDFLYATALFEGYKFAVYVLQKHSSSEYLKA